MRAFIAEAFRPSDLHHGFTETLEDALNSSIGALLYIQETGHFTQQLDYKRRALLRVQELRAHLDSPIHGQMVSRPSTRPGT
ncbi:unnamed protein product, partial [Echinostoma caproni]|uniref:TetR_C_6 domain-containing protein n=1 Tax=Echinostoma caproni TaxID=27848 RepID=A0A183A4P7_9TREM